MNETLSGPEAVEGVLFMDSLALVGRMTGRKGGEFVSVLEAVEWAECLGVETIASKGCTATAGCVTMFPAGRACFVLDERTRAYRGNREGGAWSEITI